jgi:two-component system, cell cycle sensor histidine kinase and response regulator CckA
MDLSDVGANPTEQATAMATDEPTSAPQDDQEREDALREARKADPVAQLAGRLADEFSDLLTIIYGYGDMVLSQVPPGEPVHELVRRMMAAAGKADSVTRKLVALSRTAVVRPESVDLHTLVVGLEPTIRRIIGTGIRLTITMGSKPGKVHADPGHMQQVILNLVTNARDAMSEGGRLTIDVRNADLDVAYIREHPVARPGPHVVLAVSDTGSGIDSTTMSRLFDEFVTTKGKGTGLGLAIVHRVVKQSGGHVAIASEVGRGTTVEVYLPRV